MLRSQIGIPLLNKDSPSPPIMKKLGRNFQKIQLPLNQLSIEKNQKSNFLSQSPSYEIDNNNNNSQYSEKRYIRTQQYRALQINNIKKQNSSGSQQNKLDNSPSSEAKYYSPQTDQNHNIDRSQSKSNQFFRRQRYKNNAKHDKQSQMEICCKTENNLGEEPQKSQAFNNDDSSHNNLENSLHLKDFPNGTKSKNFRKSQFSIKEIGNEKLFFPNENNQAYFEELNNGFEIDSIANDFPDSAADHHFQLLLENITNDDDHHSKALGHITKKFQQAKEQAEFYNDTQIRKKNDTEDLDQQEVNEFQALLSTMNSNT